MDITACVKEIENIDDFKEQWISLERTTKSSFFLSWGWIGNWLKILPPDPRPQMLILKHDNLIVGLAVLIKQKVYRKKIFLSNTISLNDCGLHGFNMVIEHNGILIRPSYEGSVTEAFIDYIYNYLPGWDELFINGIDETNYLCNKNLYSNKALRIYKREKSVARYVDLTLIRTNKQNYLATLSKNTRYQIKRAMRNLQQFGDIQLVKARSIDEAIEFFSELGILHQQYWKAKGQPGSFHNPVWRKFHHSVIKTCFASGNVQILKIIAGDKIIGYLYNLVNNKDVCMLQSGINYEFNNNIHPGYICHYLAIEYNLDNGMSKYDFLAGDSQYKKSLAKQVSNLGWIVIQKKHLRFKIERLLRKGYHLMGSLVKNR